MTPGKGLVPLGPSAPRNPQPCLLLKPENYYLHLPCRAGAGGRRLAAGGSYLPSTYNQTPKTYQHTTNGPVN
jgi:hypothetical protein